MGKKVWVHIVSLVCLGFLFFLISKTFSQDKKATESASSAAAEKEKALKNPYPNDLGPDAIDVSKYSAEQQEGYKLMRDKCAKCHTPSRPLNSQFLELKEDEMAAMKKTNPEIFKDKGVWQIESGLWQRYIKRMMAKPGCNISSEEGKKIWKFAVEDSKRRKIGSAVKTWSAHRKKLLADFKTKYPARHKELFETK